MTKAAVAVLVLLCVAAYYYLVDPSAGFSFKCPFRLLTGYDCPGCGIQRALHALLHGDVSKAWHYNAFAFAAIPVALLYIAAEAWGNRRLTAVLLHPVPVTVVFLGVIAWWVGRNMI
ncbi:MAG: DUF2752 domain-containing protein [Muribaculaceae bacterium]|nr:DUF2752 domain-containing protein [Muribaculaceae bacterium]